MSNFPAVKKFVLAFGRIALCAAVLASTPVAQADVTTDYEEGMRSFNNGDLFGAMPPLRRAADAGHPGAQTTLAYILDLGETNDEALRYYQQAADQDYPDGIYGLARMYMAGDGVERDRERAHKLLLKAVNLGHARSTNALVDEYLNGHFAPAESGTDIASLLKASADAGYLRAATALAVGYQSGQHGLPTDPAQAAEWKQRATALRAQQLGKDNKDK
ncbi:MAG: sel1 repeat family protein [Rhodocyclaceae bacterium]|nr:sel1 repeat family protein [Rhodocyclaceae bacterium]